MKYGLTDKELEIIIILFSRFENIEKVYLFGSRAKGTYKPFSDIDITLVGDSITHSDLNNIILAIDDLMLPYQFDISLFSNLKNEALVDHIKRNGIVLYERQK